MDLAVDVTFPFGAAQLGAAVVCVVAFGVSLIHSYMLHRTAQKNLKFGLYRTKQVYISLGFGFTMFLTCAGLMHAGYIPVPYYWTSEWHFNRVASGGIGVVVLGMLSLLGMACKRHASHHNH